MHQQLLLDRQRRKIHLKCFHLGEEAATLVLDSSGIVINNLVSQPDIHLDSVYHAVLYQASMVD